MQGKITSSSLPTLRGFGDTPEELINRQLDAQSRAQRSLDSTKALPATTALGLAGCTLGALHRSLIHPTKVCWRLTTAQGLHPGPSAGCWLHPGPQTAAAPPLKEPSHVGSVGVTAFPVSHFAFISSRYRGY